MKRSYIYVIVILLTITLVTADYIIGKDLAKIIPLDDEYRSLERNPGGAVKEASAVSNILIKNEQNSDDSIIYEYRVVIKDIEGAYRFKYNDSEGYLIFTANGETTFNLKSNEEIIIYEVPVDSEYTVIQETTRDDYTTKVNQIENNIYNSKITYENNVVFNNSPSEVEEVPAEEPQEEKPTEEQTKEEQPKEEEPKQDEPKEDNPVEESEVPKETIPKNPKDIPNTGTKEVLAAIIGITAIGIIYCFNKIRIKKYE